MPYIKKFNIDRTKPLDQQLDDVNSFMRRSSKLRRIHQTIINKLDNEFLKAWKFKRDLEFKLNEIQKIPTPKKGQRRRHPLPQSGIDIYRRMTQEQKDELKREIMEGGGS